MTVKVNIIIDYSKHEGGNYLLFSQQNRIDGTDWQNLVDTISTVVPSFSFAEKEAFRPHGRKISFKLKKLPSVEDIDSLEDTLDGMLGVHAIEASFDRHDRLWEVLVGRAPGTKKKKATKKEKKKAKKKVLSEKQQELQLEVKKERIKLVRHNKKEATRAGLKGLVFRYKHGIKPDWKDLEIRALIEHIAYTEKDDDIRNEVYDVLLKALIEIEGKFPGILNGRG